MVERNADGTVKAGALNPTGCNQHTYRLEAEEQFAVRLRRKARGASASERIINRVIRDAIAGAPHAQKLALDRILPAVSRHEVDLGESTPLDAFIQSLGAVPSRRGNGKDLEAEPSGSTKGNGGDA